MTNRLRYLRCLFLRHYWQRTGWLVDAETCRHCGWHRNIVGEVSRRG